MGTLDYTKKQNIQQSNDSVAGRTLQSVDEALGLVQGDSLKSCSLGALECALLSAHSLRDELDSPEEDEAWRDFNQEM